MRQVMVRYKVKPDRVEENEALVRAVYEELAAPRPPGCRYATFRLEDGVSFVHVAHRTRTTQPAGARSRRSSASRRTSATAATSRRSSTELHRGRLLPAHEA